MARILLHIGYPKTGTTSLQLFFSKNAEALKSRGWLYPETGRLHNAHYNISFALDIGNYEKRETQTPQSMRDALDKEIHASNCANVLLSAESFITTRRPQEVKDFFAGHDLRVLLYLRRHDHAFNSGYGQAVRSTVNPPWGPGIDSYVLYQFGISTIPWDYLQTLRRWATCIGADNLIVRPFESDQNAPDLYGDFMNAIGLSDGDSLPRPERERNTSISYRMLSIIDGLNRSPDKKEVRQELLGPLMKIANREDKRDENPILSPKMRNAILTRYRKSYEQIAKEFMGRPDGVLFKEPEPTPDDAWEPPTPATFQDAIDTLVKAMAIAKRDGEG